MAGKVQTNTGRALTVTVGLVFLVIGIFLIRYFWPEKDLNQTSSDSDAFSDVRNLRFWKATDIKQRLEAGEKIVFLDTRLRSEFEDEHILDAVWLPRESLETFDPEAGKIYVVIVSSADTDKEFWQSLVNAFNAKGMDYVFLEGGVEGWRRAEGNIVSQGDPNSFLDQSKVTFVTPEEAAGLLQNSAMLFLDVRSEREFNAGHIPQAYHLPLTELENKRGELPRGRPILVYGHDELAGFQAGVRLFDMNFFGPRVLEGGFTRWQEKNFPIEQ